MTNTVRFFICVVACEMVGVISSLFTYPAIPNWYAGLRKPFFTPPNWLFGPVWTALYFMMGIAAYLVWKQGVKNWQVRHAMFLFIVQLGLNFLWSILFFGMQSTIAGLLDIVILWVTIFFAIVAFFRLSSAAGVLLVPYFLWVTYAMILNISLWRLN